MLRYYLKMFLGWTRLRNDYCPMCFSSPPKPSCPVCLGSYRYGPSNDQERRQEWKELFHKQLRLEFLNKKLK